MSSKAMRFFVLFILVSSFGGAISARAADCRDLILNHDALTAYQVTDLPYSISKSPTTFEVLIGTGSLTGSLTDSADPVLDDEGDFDYENNFHFRAELNRGELDTEIFLVNHEMKTRSSLRGKELYTMMMEHFSPRKIKIINETWTDGDNLTQFLQGLKNGLSREEAAKQTWSGQQAVKHGFSKVINIQVMNAKTPASAWVTAQFVRP